VVFCLRNKKKEKKKTRDEKSGRKEGKVKTKRLYRYAFSIPQVDLLTSVEQSQRMLLES